MSPREEQAIRGFEDCSEDYGYLSFKEIARRSKLNILHVRRTVRSLARQGLLQYGKGLWTDDGEVAGAGYALTRAGRDFLDGRQP